MGRTWLHWVKAPPPLSNGQWVSWLMLVSIFCCSIDGRWMVVLLGFSFMTACFFPIQESLVQFYSILFFFFLSQQFFRFNYLSPAVPHYRVHMRGDWATLLAETPNPAFVGPMIGWSRPSSRLICSRPTLDSSFNHLFWGTHYHHSCHGWSL